LLKPICLNSFYRKRDILYIKELFKMPMNPIAENRYLKDKWVCMGCNATMRGAKKPVSCRQCGATKIRQQKKQRKK